MEKLDLNLPNLRQGNWSIRILKIIFIYKKGDLNFLKSLLIPDSYELNSTKSHFYREIIGMVNSLRETNR